VKDLFVMMPEIVLLTLSCLCLIVDLYLPKGARVVTYMLSQCTLIVTAICCVFFAHSENFTAFNQFVADPFAQTIKIFILGLVFLVFLYSRSYVRDRDMSYGEFHILTLFSTLGMLCLVSAKSLLIIYLGLELLSLPLYTLVALRKDSGLGVEASMKYFVTGALASGMLLYGISLLYGLSGSIQLSDIATFVQNAQQGALQATLFALVFIIAGFAFKLGAVPFHMWLPDVYEGAPTNITLLVGSAPKLAAFGMAYRLLHDALPGAAVQWSQVLMVLALLSLAIGNIVALSQTNIKRLLAYSTIAQIGYFLLALLVAPHIGYGAAMYYLVAYTLVFVAAFGIILLLSRQGFDAQKLSDLKGLAQRSPWFAFIMLLVAFSLAGVPPTIGFYAKFIVLSALVDAGYTWLAATAVVFSIIGAFYYLKIIRVMYFEPAELPYPVTGPLDFRWVLSLNGIAILALGMFPASLYMICQGAF